MSVKAEVIRILEESKGESVSGSCIAKQLGVTRASVNKAVAALRAEGFCIDAVTNRGYRLTWESSAVSSTQIEAFLNTSILGQKLYVLDTVDSTNNYVKKLAAEGESEGTLVVAKHQSAGRGRMGREFVSQKDTGVYFSLLLRPTLCIDEALLLTSAAAVAVCRAVDALAKVRTEIKWVNDVYLGGKKLCGILTEAASGFESGGVEYVVVGIGINVANVPLDETIKSIATSISDNTDKRINSSELIACVVNELEKIYKNIGTREFMSEYRERSCVIGKRVNAIRAGVSREVYAEGIDDDGALIVINENGQREHISSGEVSIRAV